MDLIRSSQLFFGKRMGKTVAVFVMGALTITAVPRWLVTVDRLEAETTRIENRQDRQDTFQELKILELREEAVQRQIWDMEDRLDDQNKAPSRKHILRRDMLLKRLDRINAEKKELRDSLKEAK